VLIRFIAYSWSYYTYDPRARPWSDPRPVHRISVKDVREYLTQHPYSESIQITRNSRWWANVVEVLVILRDETKAGRIARATVGQSVVYYIVKG
jgi:hypothetical protein